MALARNVAWLLFPLVLVTQLRGSDQGPTARIVVTEQRFCLGPPTSGLSEDTGLRPDAVTLRLQVRIYYRNPESKAIILPVVANPTVIVSRTLRDAKRGKYLTTIPPKHKIQLGDLAERGFDLNVPPKNYFEIIQPGSSDPEWYMPEDLAIRIHNPSKPNVQTELLGRNVFLQVELDHLLIPARLAGELGVKWSNLGSLWTGTVRTEPLMVTIPSSPSTSECPGELRID